jgi:peptidoglycan/xylan/chitin deacetylase (PgdA/CDA1 family)
MKFSFNHRRPLTSSGSVFYRTCVLGISIVFAAYKWLQAKACHVLGTRPSATCVVLYYHSVPSECRDSFAHQMDVLRNLALPINLNAPPTMLPGFRYAAITFDDAFEDVIHEAVPELVKRDIPAIVFAVVSVLGQTATWWPESSPERNRRIASVEQLRTLPYEQIGIGAHTMTHPRLSALDKDSARGEITRCRSKLEDLVGRKIETFSFPYGDFSQDMVRWCEEGGYSRVFTTEHRNAFVSPEDFVVGRVKVEPTDWRMEFQLKLIGAYFWLPRVSAAKHKLLATARKLGRQRSWIRGQRDQTGFDAHIK